MNFIYQGLRMWMMPAYNFQPQFVPMILDGSKYHTIRCRRKKRPTVVGDKLFLYTGMRTKKCRLIVETECKNILPVIVLRGTNVVLDGRELTDEEMWKLAKADGFDDPWKFFDFFDRYTFEERRNELEIIYWR